ncbi:MAG: bifunctional phosphopantothenoylcysteine decarboxylase/phosphopantothenate--cysteine ligase CoaBC, partial [Proteobacteria bacterium]|nr:bifunctional phosphopantothenoylcysteine decarboxylase/phosphopantothenate--cysteine ligase CoaBC [Pseudomonadota bacterium]
MVTNFLEGKKILLGVTGGIAAYKSAELLRLLIKEGAEVRVIMTSNAAKFVVPLTFRTLSGHDVVTDVFTADSSSGIDHIEHTDWADIFIIAPATANMIGKLASGIGDDALSTLALAFDKPFLIAPAMNSKMYKNSVVQGNISRLKTHGFNFVGPASGELACGYEDIGRMSEPAVILEEIISLSYEKDLKDKKILITAGPTMEDVDPVRFISNRSSGKMGYAIAREAARRGAEVTLISGPVSLERPEGLTCINVRSAEEMHKAVMAEVDGSHALIMAAAVADFKPAKLSKEKIKKGDASTMTLELSKAPDILAELGKGKKARLMVGFAAESENVLENTAKKLKEKKLDLI